MKTTKAEERKLAIAQLKSNIAATRNRFVLVDEDDNGDEYAHVQFVGMHEGVETIFDAVIYTLRLQHESELFELAEHRAAKHFPHYRKITYEEDENGNLEKLDDLEEEIGLYMAEVILELEEEEAIKVKEHVEIDPNLDEGVGLDVGLHVEKITPAVVNNFIDEFLSNRLKLDETLYSFQTQDQPAD